MTWIPAVKPEHAQGELQQAYQDVYSLYPSEYAIVAPTLQQSDGQADSIVAAHSLIPQAMKHALSAYGALLSPDLPLTRRQSCRST